MIFSLTSSPGGPGARRDPPVSASCVPRCAPLHLTQLWCLYWSSVEQLRKSPRKEHWPAGRCKDTPQRRALLESWGIVYRVQGSRNNLGQCPSGAALGKGSRAGGGAGGVAGGSLCVPWVVEVPRTTVIRKQSIRF